MKRLVAALTGLTMLAFCVGCGSDNSSSSGTESGAAKDGKEITIGYSQLGAESEWRTAQTESIKQAAKDIGWIMKSVIFDDKRLFETKKEGTVRKYRWITNEHHLA